jgi:hypothetical protein
MILALQGQTPLSLGMTQIAPGGRYRIEAEQDAILTPFPMRDYAEPGDGGA